MPAASVSGERKPISTVPAASASVSAALGDAHAEDALRAVEQGDGLDHGRARLDVRLVARAGRGSRATLHRDVEPGGDEPPGRVRHQRDPALTLRALARHDDPHRARV